MKYFKIFNGLNTSISNRNGKNKLRNKNKQIFKKEESVPPSFAVKGG